MTYNNYSTFFGNYIPTLSKKVDKTVTKTTTISTTTETTPVAKTTAHTNSDFNILFCRDFKTDVLTEKKAFKTDELRKWRTRVNTTPFFVLYAGQAR